MSKNEKYPTCEACETCAHTGCVAANCPHFRAWFTKAWKDVVSALKTNKKGL